MQIDIQGITKGKLYTDERAKVKLTLGWELVYEFEVWIMPHHAGVDVILGTDFMIPAGVRLDLFRSTMKNPEEITVPLVRSQREIDDGTSEKHIQGSPCETMDVPSGERDIEFAKLLQSSITPFVALDEAVAPLAPPSKGSATVRLAPHLLYASIARDYTGYVLSFDGSAKTEKHGGYGSCSWILWRLPAWDIVIAASAHLSSTTVNIAEYTGMNNGVKAAIDHGRFNYCRRFTACNPAIHGGDSLSEGDSTVQLTRHKELTAQINSVRYLHAIRAYNASADSLATEALENQVTKIVLSETRKAELKALNRIPEVLYADDQAATEAKLSHYPDQTVGRGENSAHHLLKRDPSKTKVNEPPQITATTRSQTRQVRFVDPNTARAPDATVTGSSSKGGASSPAEKESRKPDADVDGSRPTNREMVCDALAVQAERIRRVKVAQDEERGWADLKTYLRGNVDSLSFKRAANASKLADRFVIDEDELLQYIGKGRKMGGSDNFEIQLRLVVPTTMIDEVYKAAMILSK
ncbi:LOW QUALITY PROTEIN: Hypothetical protein PHPALM_7816, partial [Phytophthora palmivora]